MPKVAKIVLTTAEFIEHFINEANDAFEAGFTTEAARKRALGSLNVAYNRIKGSARDTIFANGREMYPDFHTDATQRAACYEYNDSHEIPYGLHEIRAKHIKSFDADTFVTVQSMIDLRKAIKEADLVLVEVSENKKRVEVIQKSIKEEMVARHESFINGYSLAKHLGGMRVTVNSHYVRHCKGTSFIRCFYFLNDKMMALNTIFAIADKIAREEEEAAKIKQ